MQKRIHSMHALLTAFIVFTISCGIAGISSLQFSSMQSVLSITSPIMKNAQQVAPTRAIPPTTFPALTARQQPTPPAPTISVLVTRDVFNRQNQQSWGQMTSGEVWQGDAKQSRGFAVVNDSGQISGQGPYYAFTPPALENAEVHLTGSASSFQGTAFGIIFHWSDANDWYNVFIDGQYIIVQKKINGTLSTLATFPFGATVGTLYTISLWVVHTTYYVKVWPVSASEPTNWMIALQDTSLPSGYYGIYTFIQQRSLVTVKEYKVSMLSYT